jgi:hypothetical protein
MLRNRVWLPALVLALCMSLTASSASAWEFSMDGVFTWKYVYLTQTGHNGFFGQYNADGFSIATNQGTSGNLNAWLGREAGNTFVSGSDSSKATQYMSTNMQIRLNPAIRVRGNYYIGEWASPFLNNNTYTAGFPTYGFPPNSLGVGNLVSSEYLEYRSSGVQRSMSPGYWNTLWLTADMPWGILAVGKRPSIFGTGLAWNGVENRSSETLSLSVPYGPLLIAIGFYPSRRANTEVVPIPNPAAAGGTALGTGGVPVYYNLDFDKTNTRIYDFGPSVAYRNGPLDAGVIVNWIKAHRGPEGLFATTGATGAGVLATDANRLAVPSIDREDFYGGVYVKYFNGRSFFNAEFDWYDRRDVTNGGSPSAGATAAFRAPAYIQAYRLMAEAGAVCGPTKLSLLYSWMNGPDRRGHRTHGINQGSFLGRAHVEQSQSSPNPIIQSNSSSNTGLFRPYSYLMVYNYGMGAFFNADTGNGYADDASIFAARLDYAIAANLNIFASGIYADRIGNAYGWGFLSPIDRAGNLTPQVWGFYRGPVPGADTGLAYTTNRRPNIPDSNLGWEIDAGFDWKLLEGLNLNATFAYWQPGKWFNYACVDKSVIGWNTASANAAGDPANYFGIRPNRTIDAILAAEIMVVGEF